MKMPCLQTNLVKIVVFVSTFFQHFCQKQEPFNPCNPISGTVIRFDKAPKLGTDVIQKCGKKLLVFQRFPLHALQDYIQTCCLDYQLCSGDLNANRLLKSHEELYSFFLCLKKMIKVSIKIEIPLTKWIPHMNTTGERVAKYLEDFLIDCGYKTIKENDMEINVDMLVMTFQWASKTLEKMHL